MSTIASRSPTDLDVPRDPIFRLTVEQYHEMIRAGILGPDDHVELLEGWLVRKMTKNPPHVVSTALTADELRRIVPAGWHVANQDPVTTRDSEPEPDVSVVRGKVRDYTKRHPGPEDLALAVEVADTSLERDRRLKARVYARAQIPIYWIVNINERVLEVYTQPTSLGRWPKYSSQDVLREGQSVTVVLDGRKVGKIAVRDLLP